MYGKNVDVNFDIPRSLFYPVTIEVSTLKKGVRGIGIQIFPLSALSPYFGDRCYFRAIRDLKLKSFKP